MADPQQRGVVRAAVVVEQGFDTGGAVLVEVAGGLVEQQRRGLAHQRAQQGQALALAGGAARHLPVERRGGQAEAVQPDGVAAVGKVLAHGFRPPLALGHHQRHLPPPLRCGRHGAGAGVEAGLALVEVEVGDGAQQQRLAAAGGAADADAFAGADGEVDRTDVAGAELVQDEGGHGPHLPVQAAGIQPWRVRGRLAAAGCVQSCGLAIARAGPRELQLVTVAGPHLGENAGTSCTIRPFRADAGAESFHRPGF